MLRMQLRGGKKSGWPRTPGVSGERNRVKKATVEVREEEGEGLGSYLQRWDFITTIWNTGKLSGTLLFFAAGEKNLLE